MIAFPHESQQTLIEGVVSHKAFHAAPLVREFFNHVVEALAAVSDEAVLGHTDVVEEDIVPCLGSRDVDHGNS